MTRNVARSSALLFAAVGLVLTAADAVRAGASCDVTLLDKHTRTIDPLDQKPGPQLLTVPQFNPQLGTLCFAVVRITADYSAFIEAENVDPANAAKLSLLLATQTVEVTPPAFISPFLSNKEEIPPASHSMDPYDGTTDFMGPSSTFFSYLPDNPRTVTLLPDTLFDSNDPNFGDFTGVGTLNFDVDGLGVFILSGSSNHIVMKVHKSLAVTIQMDYHYVPEPATLALLLPGLLLVRSRRRRGFPRGV